jgi:NADPH2 dehydrogenase
MSKLFRPLRVGNVELQHRIVMAPLTRFRADKDHVPLPFVTDYYAQRASVPGTMITTEATFIAPEGSGYPKVPGIWNAAQISAWKKVTAAVHAKESFISMQLWAIGRAASAKILQSEFGLSVKSASDIAFKGGDKPTPLTEEEILQYISLYRQVAPNAIEAGFDAVELHGAMDI